ncbi:hypothetical protein BKA82DRAFT_10201 [Pisolithus tinctorius]|uniref:Uncharacterized protein n=1 Tax=Pisolithus tinctorius Marx 270 TaxID=870435 RepID=A0A0C3NZ26_PISTI|nr:hypothetical protein BKA82DRAFT_10201 [Pisolithus tinctorius]KIO00546.1 hypothetical protein M404DRAFT_10201 [Pisolithus tinctorius Marx 270]
MDSDGTDSETYSDYSTNGMAFSFLDDSEVEEESMDSDKSSDSREELADDIICTGMRKWSAGNPRDALAQFEAEETGDYLEKCAWQAAVSVHRFWERVMLPPATCVVDDSWDELDEGPTIVVAFLDMTAEDNDRLESVPVLETVKKLIVDAKRFKSFTSLFYLDSLKQVIELWTKYQQNSQIKAPMGKASHTISAAVGKGLYMA